jgi:hypothetical protein
LAGSSFQSLESPVAEDLLGPHGVSTVAVSGLRPGLLGRLSVLIRTGWLGDLGVDRNKGSTARRSGLPRPSLESQGSHSPWSQKTSVLLAATTVAAFFGLPAAAATVGKINQDYATRCVAPAAEFHKVNPWILKGILQVESSFNALAVNRNLNGSLDVGIGQMNSIHFKELSGHGIAPSDLLDPCIGTYVAAWHLAKQLKAYGNTWFAIGAYHSATPYYNSRYQALVYNALVGMEAVAGPRLRVPPMNRGPTTNGRAVKFGSAALNSSDIVAISQ